MNTLKLFNCVKAKPGGEYKILPEYGVIVEPSASWNLSEIKKFLKTEKVDGRQLNATFHKSWKVIKESAHEELRLHQILHYMTTYGTDFMSSFVYIPSEVLNVPDVEVRFLVIRGLTKEEIIKKVLDLLGSGVALKQETIQDVLQIAGQYGYKFTGKDVIKNKEALMYICKDQGILPENPTECVRYFTYLATGDTLLIKNKKTYDSISSMEADAKISVTQAILKSDPQKLAEVFNRFKPIFLSFKKALGGAVASHINKVSKLSKVYHEPMPHNILNNMGSCELSELEGQKENLAENANFFQLARCLQYLKQSAKATAKVYNIRNGKSHTEEVDTPTPKAVESKIKILVEIIKNKFGEGLKNKKIFIPEGVFYALPVSEKMFVGNVPMGTKLVTDEPISMGIYWENKGGARDLDLSSISTSKVGWNSRFNRNGGDIMFSGDMTNADPGATEYIRASRLYESHLILNNVYNGNAVGSIFDIVVGKGPETDRSHMMDPNRVWFTAKTATVQRQTVVGMITPEDDKFAAIVLNFASGASQVSGSGEKNSIMRKALEQRWKNCFYINDLLAECEAELVESIENCDIDLTPSNLEKDTILNLFKVTP